MMKTSTKLSVTVAARMLGVALAASGAYPATGALTTRDAPGQVLQVTGAGATSDHATPTAHAHAKLPSVAKPPCQRTRQSSVRRHDDAITAGHRVMRQVARPAAQTLPAYHPARPQTTASTPPAVPQPMMSPGTNTPPSPMH
jgi:hypothetical protein